mgnify:CR=1 FL=1
MHLARPPRAPSAEEMQAHGRRFPPNHLHESWMDYLYWDAELDARGLLCPLPVLRARKRLAAMGPGAVLRVLADDPAARIDMPHFCAEAGHALLADLPIEGRTRAYLIRAGAA